jgi:hypothetical protein
VLFWSFHCGERPADFTLLSQWLKACRDFAGARNHCERSVIKQTLALALWIFAPILDDMTTYLLIYIKSQPF